MKTLMCGRKGKEARAAGSEGGEEVGESEPR